LDSLAQGRCALALGEVLVSYGGILAPAHDGFFPAFAADVRAAFDEAEPMVVQVRAMAQMGRAGVGRTKEAWETESC
jgi:putative IMPACT (imprinted ancient) family translation regulator